MRIVITGSSGYIGSVLCKLSKELGHEVLAIDHKSIYHYYYDKFSHVDITEQIAVDRVIEFNPDTIFHLAASADVTDSMINPSLYYWNNIGATSKFFGGLISRGWKGSIIFSSTAAVYGISEFFQSFKETSLLIPPNSYGMSKLMCEQYFYDISQKHNIKIAMFRYFNVAGAYGDVGDHIDSNHVLQKLCYSYKTNKPFNIYGTDLKTIDGSCVRDYVHVLDVCYAHFRAYDYLKYSMTNCNVFNLGSGNGISVKQLIDSFKKNIGNITTVDCDMRLGDPKYLVASPDLFIRKTKFKYEYSDIDNIVISAWEWFRSNYNAV